VTSGAESSLGRLYSSGPWRCFSFHRLWICPHWCWECSCQSKRSHLVQKYSTWNL